MAGRNMRGIVRVVIFIGVLAVVIAGVLFAASRLMSPNFIVAQLQEQVRQQTGRTLTVGGRPSITFFPRISVELPDVRLSNPPGMDRGDFLRVKKLQLQVELWPLLQREVILERLRLVQPEVHLLLDEQGRNNWTFATSGKTGAASSGNGAAEGANLVRRIRLAPVELRDGRVLFEDRRANTRQEVRNLDVVVRLSSPASPLDVQGGAVWRKQRVKFSLFVKDPARLAGQGSPLEAFIQAAGAKIEYTGLAGFGSGLTLAGKVAAEGPSLRGLLHWLGVGIAPQGGGLGRFSLSGGIDAANNVFTLNRLQLALDDSRAQGSVRLDLSGRATALKAALGVDKVVTDLYLGPAPKAAGGKRVGQGGGWSSTPMIPDLPRDLDADVRISVSSLRHRQLKMGPGALRLLLKGGGLSARLEKMGFYGGGLSGKVSIIPGRDKPRIAGAFRVDKVSARPFLVDFVGFDYLSGQLTGEVDVKSFGRSQLEIIGNLTGLANLTFREGKVHGVDLVKLMETVQKGIVNGWRFDENATTDFVELVAKFVIIDGIARVRQLDMKGPLLRVNGKGEVDLLRQLLDLSLGGGLVKRKDGREKTLLEMPVPLLVKGPWQGPKIYPDIAGVLQNPQAAFSRLQQLMQGLGARKPAKKLDKVRDKAKEKVKAAKAKLEDKAKDRLREELGKVVGEDNAARAAEKAGKQMEKLLRGFFGQPKPAQQPQPQPQGQ